MAQTELTRMFASLGFKVDDTGAAQFESRLRTLRENSAMFARNLGVVANKLTLVKKKVDALNRSLASDSKSSKSKNNKGMSESYSRLANYVERVEQSHKSITTHEPVLVKALNNIRTTVWKGSNAWEVYRKNVSSANNEMRSFKQSMADMRRGTGSVAVNNKYYGGSQTSPRPSVAHPPQSPTSAAGGAMMFGALGGGVKDFFRSMTPATAIAGGLVSAGFAAKEVVQRGREMTKMNNVLLMAASGQEQYAEALQFVNKESHRLGQSTQELGMAFGKVLQSARGKMKYEDIEKVFTGFGELMTAMGANVDDQKGIYRAFGQMLTKGKIEAEEEGQMAERGLPAKELIKQSAMEVYGVDSAGYEKMRQKGAVKVEDIAVNLSNRMRAMANNNDALNKMLQTSAVAQQRFMNAIDKLAQTIMSSGLDKALFYVFSGMAKILEVIEPMIKGFGAMAKGLGDLTKVYFSFANENKTLMLGILATLLMIVRFTKASEKAGVVTRILSGDITKLNGKYLALAGRVAKTTLVVWALFEAMSALERSNSGEVNWVTLLGAQFQILYGTIDLAAARIENFFLKLKYYAKNPMQLFGADSTFRASEMIPGIGVLKYAKNALRKMEDRFNPRQEPDKDRFPSTLPDFQEPKSSNNTVNILLKDQAGNILDRGSARLGDLSPLTLTQP
jgi:tape measure domain-containing protein